MRNKIKLKKGDEVIVLAGKDKGKIGKITLVKPQVNKAIVAGINKVKKNQKPETLKNHLFFLVFLKRKSNMKIFGSGRKILKF